MCRHCDEKMGGCQCGGGCGGHSCGCGGSSCGQGSCSCQEEEEECGCQCHEPEMCEDCAKSGHKVKFLVMKAMKKMLVSRIREKLEKKYGKKMDAVADMAFEAFEKHIKLKKEMMAQEEFDLKEKMMSVFKE